MTNFREEDSLFDLILVAGSDIVKLQTSKIILFHQIITDDLRLMWNNDFRRMRIPVICTHGHAKIQSGLVVSRNLGINRACTDIFQIRSSRHLH